MTITERAAYIKGLAEGLGIDDSTKEGKIINAMIGALDDMAITVADLEAEIDELREQVDTIDEDLGDLEEEFYDMDEDECCCGHDHGDEDEDADLYEVCCPTCGDIVCLDSAMLDEGQTTCPNCGELLEFDLDEEEAGSEDCDKQGDK